MRVFMVHSRHLDTFTHKINFCLPRFTFSIRTNGDTRITPGFHATKSFQKRKVFMF